jgi:hypothetical protein
VGLGDVHEALARAGGRRIDPDPATGLEFVIVRDVVVDPIVRALLPESAPPVEWLGIPVRWTTVARDGDTTYELRSFHVITELGPRSIVEFVVREGEQVSARRELVLVQGEALAVTAASPQWPAPAGMRHPPEGGVRRAFGWESESPLALLVLRPRFEGR